MITGILTVLGIFIGLVIICLLIVLGGLSVIKGLIKKIIELIGDIIRLIKK